MLAKIYGSAVQGVQAYPVTIEVGIGAGKDSTIVGLPDPAVKESMFRMDTAVKQSGFQMPRQRVIVNLAPADIRKEGSAYDLPIAIGVLLASGQILTELIPDYIIMGELSLDGSLRPIKGVLPIAIEARDKFKGFILPKENAGEAAIVSGLDVIGVESLAQAADFLEGRIQIEPLVKDTRDIFFSNLNNYEADFSHVQGQENIKRALEIAAAGGHNAIMIGPPGAGKTMLARRLPSILPPLDLRESLETTKIHSVAGKLSRQEGLVTTRPFRAPHLSLIHISEPTRPY